MTEKKLYQLKIDSDFRDIICPMTQAERLQLEDNILADGCREPLIVWNGTTPIISPNSSWLYPALILIF